MQRITIFAKYPTRRAKTKVLTWIRRLLLKPISRVSVPLIVVFQTAVFFILCVKLKYINVPVSFGANFENDSSIFQTILVNKSSVNTSLVKPSASELQSNSTSGETTTTTSPLNMSDCISEHLTHYEQICLKRSNQTNTKERRLKTDLQRTSQLATLCPCIPKTLVGVIKPSTEEVSDSALEAEHGVLIDGGHWAPSWCVPRQRVAIIIPFRDRETHLRIFLKVIHPFLQRQLLDYNIFVVEQRKPEVFNKAMLMNAGFVEVRSRGDFDCFIFHDVDMLPEDDRNFYGCTSDRPRHVGAYFNKRNYVLKYSWLFGGATAFKRHVFEKVNGFSNEFYGWGGEDDDMSRRLDVHSIQFERYPNCVARYTMIQHDRDRRNPYAHNRLAGTGNRPQVYMTNGLNSLRYIVVETKTRRHFTWILIDLPPPPVLPGANL